MAIATTMTGALPSRTARKGFFRRYLEAVTASRQAEADRIIASHLLTLDDATLSNLGHDRARLVQVSRQAGFRY